MRKLLAIAIVCAAQAGAYYHYIHYQSRNAPYTPIQEKFDLNALPNKTVALFVSDSGPSSLLPNDSFASVLSQVRQAAVAWNSVDSSDLRVSFGGLIQGNSAPNSPGVQVVFGELAPGVLALTVPIASGSPSFGPSGPFFPLQRSIITMRRDLTSTPGPSYGTVNPASGLLDGFFTTAVHELGHALGLQHTFTSSAMTVAVNRNINRSRPLDADDVAGLSLLYPKAGYLQSVGAIVGRVTANGQPVPLASVVALRPAGAAISTLTDPDGRYRLDGLPPDTYFVYTHTVPPGADIRLPVDFNGTPFSAGPAFATVFYPGTRDITQFAPINVSRGNTVGGIDFAVAPQASVPVYDGAAYSYYGPSQTPVKPAFANSSNSVVRIAFNASPATPVPVSAQVLGVDPNVGIQPYGSPVSLALDVHFPLGAGTGPRHLLLNLGNDLYVLPSALNLVQKQPPQNVSVFPNGESSAVVSGQFMGADSRVFFDGLPATVRNPFTGSDGGGTLVVTPPTGFSGQRATVAVFNADGQSSMFLQWQNPPVYAYPGSDFPQVSVSLNALPAGASAMVDIIGNNTNFVDGQVTVGFGTPDIFVRKVWVLGPNRAVANVSVLPNAALAATELSVISGFQTIVQPFAFNTQPQNPRLPNISLPIVNTAQNQANIFAGAFATMTGTNLAQAPASASVILADAAGNSFPTQIVSASPNQITFVVPPNMPTGLATLRLSNGTDAAFPVALQIDSQPPVIAAVSTSSNVQVDSSRALSTGEVLTLTMLGLDPGVIASPSRLRVTASGIDLPVTLVQGPSQGGVILVQIVINQSFGGQQVPLSVSQDGSMSNPYPVVIR